MIKVSDWVREIDALAPFCTAMDFDNVGLLVGSGDAPAPTALLALDLTAEVVDEAAEKGIPLIITHHPVIFQPLKRLSGESLVYRLAANGIAVISAHTNLDLAEGGVNDALARRLGLGNIRGFHAERDGLFLGRLGETPREQEPLAFAKWVKETLGAGGVRLVRGNAPVRTVAVCGGSGGGLLEAAAQSGAQALVTGEAKHNELLLADELGVTLVDAGHYFTEAVVIEPLAEWLRERLSGSETIVSRQHTNKVIFV